MRSAFVRVVSAALVALAWSARPAAAAQVDQIFPFATATSTAPPGGPYLIAMVSDQFTDHDDFVSVATTLASRLMTSEFYKSHPDAFTIESFYDASSETSSRFGFHEVVGGPCSIAWNPATTTGLVEDAIKPASADFIIVVGNNDAGAYGCTTPDWMYLTSGSRFGGTVLPHELGHAMAGLFDEYVTQAGAYPGAVDRMNCSTQSPPYWSSWPFPAGTAAPPNVLGCALYPAGIKRPYDAQCRMHDDSGTPFFCLICEAQMCVAVAKALGVAPLSICNFVPPQRLPSAPTNVKIVGAKYFQPPFPPPVTLDDKIVRVVVELSASGGAVARSSTDVVGRIKLHQQRVGDYVYAIVENNVIQATGVISGDPFQVRGYQGKATPHRSAEAPTAEVVVQIPRATQASLKTRHVTIAFYRLDPLYASQQDVTPDLLRTILQSPTHYATPVGSIKEDDLKKVLK
jgi:hypothetical protein